MRINAFSGVCVAAGLALALHMPSTARAQGASKGTISVAGEVGVRSYTNRLDSLKIGKFEEYRDLHARDAASPVFEQLLLKYTPADSFGTYALSARKLFDRDQSIRLLAKRPGSYDFRLDFDRITHTYATDARSPGGEFTAGHNTLPSVRPDSLAWRNAPYLAPLRSQWDPMMMSLAVTPNEQFDFKADYTRIAKSGNMPGSLTFNASTGPQREFVSPIDQTMNDVHLSQAFTSGDRKDASALTFIKSYQINAGYGYSRFQNAYTSILVDNPMLNTDSPTTGAATSRLSMPPNNSAQSASLVGALQFPARTRVTGSFAGSWAAQNDPFVPQSSNAALAADPNYGLVGTLPRASLDGHVRTTTYSIAATSHPISRLSLGARYRSFDYSNSTAAFKLKAMVISDRSIALADSEAFEPDPFTKTNSEVNANYEIANRLSLGVAYGWEDWTRDPEVRNVAKTSETMPRVSLDYTALDWLSLRASYVTGRKRMSGDYTQAASEIATFRRPDQANRDRTRVNVMTSINPTDDITLGLTYQTGDDKFTDSPYGIQSDKSTMQGVNVDWSPGARFGISVGYENEATENVLDMRLRTGAVGSATYDNPTYRWTSTTKDRNNTTFVNLTSQLIPDKLDLIGSMSIVAAKWRMYNFNPTTPTGGTAAQNLNATAQDWPEVNTKMQPASLSLRYRYSADWAMTLRYQMETYDQVDFRTSAPVFTSTSLAGGPVITSFTGALPGSIGAIAGTNTGQYHFLGVTYLPYTVNWVTVTVTYHPSMIPFTKGRSAF